MYPQRCRPLLLPVLVAAAFAAVPAAAQTAPGSSDASAPAAARNPNNPQLLESLTVTGTRRREPVKDVPVQITTLPAEELEATGAKTLSDYLATQPGLDIKTSGGPGLGGLTIRGVSTGDATIATVGVYLDDVPFGSSSAYAIGSGTALDMGLLDLARVEVLRGPQGTIYGASTMGGLIKYVTNDPDTSRFFGRAKIEGSTTAHGSANNTVSAMLNAPLSDSNTVGLRVAAFRDHSGGFVDATGDAAGTDVNTGNTVGGRVSLLAQPAPNMSIKLSATTQEVKRESQDLVDYDINGQAINGELSKKLAEREPYKVKTNVAGLEFDWDLGWARFDSITSAQKTEVDKRTDATYVYGPLLLGFGLDLDRVILDNAVTVKREVQELRLTSPRGPIEWLAGFFYSHEKGTNGQFVTSRFRAGAAPGPDLATVSLPSEYTENAVFGDITWNPTRELALTGGIRSSRNKQTFDQISDGPLVGGSTNVHGESSETTQTYLATARYLITPTSTVYARAASGFRPGGPNAVFTNPNTGEPLAPTIFKSDSLWSYELGYKAELMQRTLAFEAAIYDIKWKDIQQPYAVNGIGVIVNAGKAQVDGAEIALRYRPAQDWTFDVAYTYIDARLTEDAPGLGQSGARLPNSAKSSATAGASYLFQAGGYRWEAGANLRYVGERNAGFDGNNTLPNYKLPDYTLFDMHASVDFKTVQVGVYGRNLADKRAQLGAATNFVPLGGYVQVTPVQPRTFGVSVSGTF